MKHLLSATLLLMASPLTAPGSDNPPVWAATAISGDPLFFVKPPDGPAKALLLHVPAEAPVLRSATREQNYEAGKDYTWTAGSREVVLTEASRIPFKTAVELHPAPNAPHSYRACRDGKSWMLFGEGRFFHDLQSVASYRTEAKWDGPQPQPAPDVQLGPLREKLKAGQDLKLVTLGDSISTGANASGAVGAPPGQQGYHLLLAAALTERFGVKVAEKNLSVGGMDAAWGLKQVPAVIAEKPDMVVLAFGMNDASGRRAPEEFARLIRETREGIRAALPECSFILVSPMTANEEWTHAAPELYPLYAAQLTALAGPRCAAANVTEVWTAVAARKNYLSLSGNGLNHPNDFGHRIYADVVLTVIGGK